MDRQELQKLMRELRDLTKECDDYLATRRCALWDPDWSCSAVPPAADELDEALPGGGALLEEDE